MTRPHYQEIADAMAEDALRLGKHPELLGEKPGLFQSSAEAALAVLGWLAFGAVLLLAGAVALTVAHAVLTAAQDVGPTLDMGRIVSGGW